MQNNSPNREQDQGPYTLALKVRYLQTCVRRQTSDHRHGQLPGESKNKVSIEYVQ